MAVIIRSLITDPPTSREVTSAIRAAIDDGSRTTNLALDNGETVAYRIDDVNYRPMTAHVVGHIVSADPPETMTLVVTTHPDLSDTPTRATIIRRSTP